MNIAEWLEALGFTDDEFVAICHKNSSTQDFRTAVLPPAAVAGYVEQVSADADVWLGVNPTLGPIRTDAKRGGAESITRLTSLYCDLDIKANGCRDFEHANQIVAELSSALGEYPTMLVYSGHGIQPYWAIEDGEISDSIRGYAEQLLSRWGRLVRAVASDIKVDSVFDLPRILRCPDTANRKESVPIDVTCVAGQGAPMDTNTIAERLDEMGIFAQPDSADAGTGDVSDPDGWDYASKSCGYIAAAAREWMTADVDGRHPWALRCMVRLECARRFGCVERELYQGISQMIEQRFLNLLATQQPTRTAYKYEWRDICLYAERLASVKSASDLMSELGNHDHLIADAVKAGNVRQLPTGRNAGKGGSTGGSAPGIATVTPIGQPASGPAGGASAGGYSMTDVGNAARLVIEHSQRLRYVPEHKIWLCWDGTVWRASADDSPAIRAAQSIVETLPVIPGDKTALAFKKKSMSKNGILAMVRLAQANINMQVAQQDLDSHAYELNTPDGIVDLRSGQLLSHDPTRWHTRITGVHYDPTGADQLWKAFLRTTFQAQAEMISYVQRLAGYSCIGEVTHHILPFLYGEVGQNGKSVLLRTFQDCLGTYATTLPVAVLVAGRSGHTEDIAGLAGTRLAICSEVGHDTRWDEEKIKYLTGGDAISARHLYGKNFTFTPSHTIMIAANDRPRVDAGGKSFFRRLKLIPFDNSIPDDEIDERLPVRLLEQEGAAILAWMVRGAVEAYASGMPPPQMVIDATDEYAETEDELGQWITECCYKATMDNGTRAGNLYNSYKDWCSVNGIKARSNTAFGIALGKHGFPKRRTEMGNLRLGIYLLDDRESAQFLRGGS